MKYKLVKRRNPQKPSEPEKYYAVQVNAGSIELRELVDEISALCSLTPADVSGVLEALLSRLPSYLMNGHSVKLGSLGTVRLTIKSSGVEKKEDFTNADIKSVHLRLLPGTEMKHRLKKTKFSQY